MNTTDTMLSDQAAPYMHKLLAYPPEIRDGLRELPLESAALLILTLMKSLNDPSRLEALREAEPPDSPSSAENVDNWMMVIGMVALAVGFRELMGDRFPEAWVPTETVKEKKP